MTSQLRAISPLDGRYRSRVEPLAEYFSEFALIRARVEVESRYFIALSTAGVVRKLTSAERAFLSALYESITEKEAERVKAIETKTRHDVKATEYWMKERMKASSLKDVAEFVHFALTSTDTDNIAYALLVERAVKQQLAPHLKALTESIVAFAVNEKKTAMLARTHGQPAVPTTLGKEFALFAVRLARVYAEFRRNVQSAKLNGAVGNFNAHSVCASEVDWPAFSEDFIKGLGLRANLFSTQIEQHDELARTLDAITRLCGVLINVDRDCWTYISQDRLVLKAVAGEVGSSTMPQKVNPIDFENSEGNAEIAIALTQGMSRKLLISRMQRDLSDTTVLRNIGVIFGHVELALSGTMQGLGKVAANRQEIARELADHPEILSEAYQTIMRSAGVDKPYEKMKELVRGKKVTLEDMRLYVMGLKINDDVKRQLLALTPEGYTGYAVKLTDRAIATVRRELA